MDHNITFMNVFIVFPYMLTKNTMLNLWYITLNCFYLCNDYLIRPVMYLIRPVIYLITFLPDYLLNYFGINISSSSQPILTLITVMIYIGFYYCLYRIYKFILTRIFLMIYFGKFNVFYNNKFEDKHYQSSRKMDKRYKPFVIIKKNGKKVFGFLYNKKKIPEFTDNLILLSLGFMSADYHTNFWGGRFNGGRFFNWPSILEKSDRTIVVYNYSCAGMFDGFLTEESMYDDIENVWSFLMRNKAKPQKIIVYGRCIGGSVASHLVMKIVAETFDKTRYPSKLVLENIFVNTANLIYLYCCVFGFILPIDYEFNTYKHLKFIDKSIHTVLAYSSTNNRVLYNRYDFNVIQDYISNFVTIYGNHIFPEFTKEFTDHLMVEEEENN